MTRPGIVPPIEIGLSEAATFARWVAEGETVHEITADALTDFLASPDGGHFAQFLDKLGAAGTKALKHRRSVVSLKTVTRQEASAALYFLGLRFFSDVRHGRSSAGPTSLEIDLPAERVHMAAIRIWLALVPALRGKGAPLQSLADARALIAKYEETPYGSQRDAFSGVQKLRAKKRLQEDAPPVRAVVDAILQGYEAAGVPPDLRFSAQYLEARITTWLDQFHYVKRWGVRPAS